MLNSYGLSLSIQKLTPSESKAQTVAFRLKFDEVSLF